MLPRRKIIINGHGAKTARNFSLSKKCTLYTPETLDVDYTLSVGADQGMEREYLLQGKLGKIANGAWVQYPPEATIPDVNISPWQKPESELAYFRRILHDKKKWTGIVDGDAEGLYLDRDKDAILVVRLANNALKHLKGDELKAYLADRSHEDLKGDDLKAHLADFPKPVFFYAPKVGKVKILGKTSLSEINAELPKIDSSVEFEVVVATCNAGKEPKSLRVDTTNLVKVDDIPPPPPPPEIADIKATAPVPIKPFRKFLNQILAGDKDDILALKFPDLKAEDVNYKFRHEADGKTYWTTPLIQLMYLAATSADEDNTNKLLDYVDKMLLIEGIDINMTQDQPATTALHKAIFYGGEDPDPDVRIRFQKIAEKLISMGANQDIRNEQGYTVKEEIKNEDFAEWYRIKRKAEEEKKSDLGDTTSELRSDIDSEYKSGSHKRTKGFFEPTTLSRIEPEFKDMTIKKVKPSLYVVTDEKKDIKIAIHPQKIVTDRNNVDSFVKMLKIGLAANPGRQPTIKTNSHSMANWQVALELVFPDPKDRNRVKFVDSAAMEAKSRHVTSKRHS
jgi:hypothetical protein